MAQKSTQKILEGNSSVRIENYWKNRLLNFETSSYFDFTKRSSTVTVENKKCVLSAEKDVVEQLDKLAKSNKAKQITLMTTLAILVNKYTNLDDIGMYTPIYKDIENSTFSNKVVPVRISSFSEQTFSECLNAVKVNWMNDLKHVNYHLDKITGNEDPKRESFSAIGFLIEELQDSEIIRTVNPELLFSISLNKGLTLSIEYNNEKYCQEYIAQIGRHFFELLKKVTSENNVLLKEISLVSKEEKHNLLNDFNSTLIDFPENSTILDFFISQVRTNPERCAIQFEEEKLTYLLLNKKSNKVANFLKEKFPEKGTVIGVHLDRSIELMVAIFGILKAGCTYLPLSKNYPAERTAYSIEDSKAKLVFTDEEETININNNVPHVRVQELDSYSSNDINLATAEEVAYIIYTSGSTGKPKGVLIKHNSIVNRLNWMQNKYGLSQSDVLLQKTPIVFDVSIWELFWWSMVGAKLVLAKPDVEKEPKKISEIIKNENVSVLHFVPSMLNVFLKYIANNTIEHSLNSIEHLFTSGEELKVEEAKLFFECFPNAKLHNLYGPTEATVDVSYHEVLRGTDYRNIPIGKPIDNTQLYVLNERLDVLPIGVTGELFIGGVNLSPGYLNQDKLTREKFIKNPFDNTKKIYKTGDLARWNYDGELEFLGRIDNQVKIRGNRIELGEIENRLMVLEYIQKSVVIAKNEVDNTFLIAYYVSNHPIDEEKLRLHLVETLPDYMIPNFFVHIKDIPLTINGKVNRKKLPSPKVKIDKDLIKPSNETEEKLIQIWARILNIDEKVIGLNSNFLRLGGNSLKMIQLNALLSEELGVELPITELFRHYTISSLVDFLGKTENLSQPTEIEKELNHSVEVKTKKSNFDTDSNDIAIIGMEGKFPGASNLTEFWDNLSQGKCSITELNDDEILEEGEAKKALNNSAYVKANAFVEDKQFFDADFFGYRPDEAKLMDPQLRMFHEICWNALEDAGYDVKNNSEKIGLYAGGASNLNWQTYTVLANQNNSVDSYTASQLRDINYLCSRVSYALNFNGPAVYMNTACSTSLVAIQRACLSLLSGESSMAIAGGITLNNYSKKGYYYKEGMINSPDGKCRAFDEKAKGTVGGEGTGVVVLKKLKDAIEEGCHIYAVIKGGAINNDGDDKIAFTAPSIDGQYKVIKRAIENAAVPIESIGYVEAHGTGTTLGDPIEVKALNMAYGKNKSEKCALGSVKTNIGHLDIASGVAGLIKTALALQNKQIPPSLNFKKANPKIDFENSRFYVNTKLKEWKRQKYPLRAGISSFGIGGTNSHIILEEAPIVKSNDESREYQLLTFSGETKSSLKNNISNFRDYLKTSSGVEFSDIAYTLKEGRTPMRYRYSCVGKSKEDISKILSKGDIEIKTQEVSIKKNKPVVFMFSGQGSQYVNMCKSLYDNELVFRKELYTCFKVIENATGEDFSTFVFDPRDKNKIHLTKYTQPLLFAFEYAMAKLLMNWNVFPDIMIGHSIGEYVAACLSGAFSLEDALLLIIKRGELMQRTETGSMLGISISEKDLMPILNEYDKIDLAAVNSSKLCVVAGAKEEILFFKSEMEKKGHRCTRLKTSHAFHSRAMDSMLQEFKGVIGKVKIKKAKIPFISNFTGKYVSQDELDSPEYWLNHLRHTVKFSKGLEELLSDNDSLFIELGPGNTLSTFVKTHKQRSKNHTVINMIRHPKEERNDTEYLLANTGKIWEFGIPCSWSSFYANESRKRVSIPTYSFDKVPFPVHVDAFKMITDSNFGANGSKLENVSNWLYLPTWKLSPIEEFYPLEKKREMILIFSDTFGITDTIKSRLAERETTYIEVKRGKSFKENSPEIFTVNPDLKNDLTLLFNRLKENNTLPSKIVFAWDVLDEKPLNGVNDSHFYTLIEVIKNYEAYVTLFEKQLVILSNEIHNVLNKEIIVPEKTLHMGLVKVLAQELPTFTARNIDVSLLEEPNTYADILFNELYNTEKGSEVAIRKGLRWERIYEKIKKPTSIPKNLILEDGLYLITGGLGDLGYTIAQYLLTKYNARVALIGRSDIHNIGTKESDKGILNEKLTRLKNLELMGTVTYHKCDIANEIDFAQVITNVKRSHGNINGVIHAAGIVNGKSKSNSVLDLTRKDYADQFNPKIDGIKSLYKVFEKSDLDFCIVTSSLASILGGFGYGAYSSANIFMDYFIKNHINQGELQNWVSLNLDGLSLEQNSDTDINKEELIELFERVLLHKNLPQIIVSTVDLNTKIEKWIKFKEDDNNLKIQALEQGKQEVELSLEEKASYTEIELSLLKLWRHFFGKTNLGIHDDFFEIGGDSLKALTIIGRIHKELKIDISVSDFFKAPTIRELSNHISEKRISSSFLDTINQTKNTELFTF